MADVDRIAAALRYQQKMDAAQRPATMNPNIAAQGATGRALVAPPTSVMDERYPAWKKSQDDAENLINAADMIGAAIPLAGPAVKGAAALGRYAGPELARGLENYMGRTGMRLNAVPSSQMTDGEMRHLLAQQRAALPVEKGGLGLPAGNTSEQRAAAMGRAAAEIANAEMAGRAGLSGQGGAITLAKTGSVPKSIENQKIKNLESAWRNSDLLTFANPKATSAIVRGNPNMTIKELSDGKLLLEHSPMWGSTEKPFYIVGNDVGELVSSAIPRLERSNKAVDAAKKSKFDNSLLGKLTAEYGDTFSTAKSGRSESNYITHEPSGTKIRISEHNLPLGYVQPDVDLRIGQSLDEQLAEIRKVLGQQITEPTNYLSAESIVSPHGVRDKEKLLSLTKSMKDSGWQGRPILTYDVGRGEEALTGSHRIEAARQANIDVPIYRIENAGDYVDKNGKSILDVGFMEIDDQIKWLNKFGDKDAAKLLKQEKVTD